MTEPTAYEQYLLELINADRAKAGAQPLADNGQLNQAAGAHSQWMIDTGIFSHTGANGSSPTDRILASGYHLTGAWSDGENIGMVSTQAPSGYADEVERLHTNFMNSPGHRANILNGAYTEVGLGLRVGGSGAYATEDFAHSGSQHFLTGVAYDDTNHNHFYNPGEGLGGIDVLAVSSSGAKYEAHTYGSGGYDIALPSGSYTVTYSGANIATTTRHVDVGSNNVKVDLVDPAATGATQPASTPATSPDPAPTSSASPAPTPSTADMLSGHGFTLQNSQFTFSLQNGHFVFV